MSGAGQAGQHERAAAGQPLVQFGGGGQPVLAGQVDVDHGDVGPGAHRGVDHRVAPVDAGHHVEVVLEGEHGDQGLAEHSHVLRHHDPDHSGLREFLTLDS
nr:hypothetical protein GCM10020092_076150 [Actinoplanes digitatis]